MQNQPTDSENSDQFAKTHPHVVDDTVVWERLSEIIEAYSQKWESAPPEPQLAEFIPGDDLLRRSTKKV